MPLGIRVNAVPHEENWPIWVEYFHPSSNHGHLLLLRAAHENIPMMEAIGNIEDAAGEFVELFERCDNERHKGRAHIHEPEEIKLAYEAAVFQLLTVDYAKEWAEIERKQRVFAKWGGQPPAAVLSPTIDDDKEWEILIPDNEGNPSIYRVHKGIMDDIMPSPRELGAQKNQYGLGWTLPRRRN
jgi:hypothetical protein